MNDWWCCTGKIDPDGGVLTTKGLYEECGCSADKTHDNWIDDNLSKIDKMVGAPNAGDIGAGGCPPGQHFCASSNSCREDNPPQIEPLTLMGVDVINLQERINGVT